MKVTISELKQGGSVVDRNLVALFWEVVIAAMLVLLSGAGCSSGGLTLWSEWIDPVCKWGKQWDMWWFGIFFGTLVVDRHLPHGDYGLLRAAYVCCIWLSQRL